jgi:NSS family neurotransmitter:Na+ symporter
MFALTPTLVAGTLLTWVLIFLIIFKGVHNVGRIVMITVPLPVVLLIVILIRGLTLPGAADGLLYYLRPDWALLKDAGVWIAAYGQVFFSLSLGFGILIAYASYMPPESDVTNSAFITSLGNCCTSFIAGMAVFSTLGYLAYVSGVQVPDVVDGGPGLVFVVYPMALAKMPMGLAAVGVVSFLFFLCLITLGIDSAFSLVEGIVTGFRDRFPHLSRERMTAIVCVLGCCGSLFFCTRSGLMWLDIVDNWMNNYGLPLVGLLECVAVGYFFHIGELKDYINEHSEIKVHNWFDAFIKFVTPAILIYLLGQRFLSDVTTVYGGYDGILKHSVTLAGWGWFLVVVVGALLLARNYRVVGGVVCTLVLFVLGTVVLQRMSGASYGDVVAPAAMGAVAAAILFGGLFACIRISMETRHRVGVAMDDEDLEESIEAARGHNPHARNDADPGAETDLWEDAPGNR